MLSLASAQLFEFPVTPGHVLRATGQVRKALLRLAAAAGQVALAGEDQLEHAALQLGADRRQLSDLRHACFEISR